MDLQQRDTVVIETLKGIRYLLDMANRGMQMAEAVHDIRVLSPNDLSEPLKDLSWCIARLNGVTKLETPPSRRPTELSGQLHQEDAVRIDRSVQTDHPGMSQ